MADVCGELRSGDLLPGWLSFLMALVWAASPAALAMLAPGWKLLALLALLEGSFIDSFRLDNVKLGKDVEGDGLGVCVGGSGRGLRDGACNRVNCTWRWIKKGAGRPWSLEVETERWRPCKWS